MADEDTIAVDLAAVHTAMKTAFEAAFPGATVDYYSRPGEKVALPGIFFELDGIEPDQPDNIGTEQFACVLRFAAYVITTYKLPGKLQARTLALALGAVINANRFGCPVGPGHIHTIVEDTFHQDNKEYNVMRVDWTHTALAGVSIWQGTNNETPPEHVYLGFAPFIGPDHLNDYTEITQP
jgi:hypothetical protein